MKMKKIQYHFAIAAAAFGLTMSSCSESFLDKLPDERTEIDSEDKVIDLLKSAYPSANYSWIAELSSDNVIDNSTPHYPTNPNDKQILAHYNYSSYDRWDDQLYKFEPATMATYSDYDSPGSLWGGYYEAIATVNHALQAIDEIEAKSGMTKKLKAAKAEALLIRAYCHFCLVNVFAQAYKDDASNSRNIGVPYVTAVENVVHKDYPRGTVKEVYDKIQADLEAGLADLNEGIYDHPKWHFNMNAAHAFAARFYLYKREYNKVIEHANAVLGNTESSVKDMLLDFKGFTDCTTLSDYKNVWQNPSQNNNLLLMTTGSLLYRRCWGYRYSCAGLAARDVYCFTTANRDFWSGYMITPLLIANGAALSSSTQDYGYISSKIFEQFEYSDKIAGIGYPHIILRAFTANELLLERAEAYILTGQIDLGAQDLCYYWNLQIDNFSEEDRTAYFDTGYIKYITKEAIYKYYSVPQEKDGNVLPNWDFTQNISSDFVVTPEEVPYMNCLGWFRRMETMFEGLRFFDLKRWGMEWSHKCGLYSEEIFLTKDDPNRAIEVPWEAISAGMESSRPTVSSESNTNKLLLDPEQFRVK